MDTLLFIGWGDEDNDSFSAVGWTNYPDDGSIDDQAELASDLVEPIQVLEEISSALDEGVSQSPYQEENHSQWSSL